MLIETERIENHLLVHINEDILMDNSRDFFLEFEHILRNLKADLEFLTIDFGRVRFLDSSGIGAVIKCTNRAKEFSIDVKVVNLNKTLHSVFRLSGLEHILIALEVGDFLQQFPQFKESLSNSNE